MTVSDNSRRLELVAPGRSFEFYTDENKTIKFPFNFLRLPPAPPAVFSKERKFLVLVRDQREREARRGWRYHIIGAYDLVQSHHALRALQVNRSAIGNKFEQRL